MNGRGFWHHLKTSSIWKKVKWRQVTFSWFHFNFSSWLGSFRTVLVLFTGAMLIARWILNEEDIDENDTYVELDRIACTVQESLRGNSSSTSRTPTAPLEERMAQSNEEFRTVTHPTACLRILDCLKHVLYQQLQFKGNVNEYYKKDNSMLYQVWFCHDDNKM